MYTPTLSPTLSAINKNSLVRLSVPLSVPEDDSVIIGYYGAETGAGYITVPQGELESAAGILYMGKHFPVAVHGLMRVREIY
jgi:hypothetical protein